MRRPSAGSDPILSSLSLPLRTVWAKTPSSSPGAIAGWNPLVAHAMDTAGIIEYLWDQWLSPAQHLLLSKPFESLEYPLCDHDTGSGQITSPTEAAKSYVCLAGALHDAGKISKPFSNKVPVLASRMRQAGFKMPERGTADATAIRHYRHALASQLILVQQLRSMADSSMVAALAAVAGSHHGTTPTELEIKDARDTQGQWSDQDGIWTDCQSEFVRFCVNYTETETLLKQKVKIPQAHAVITSGLLIVADWIASSQDLFPLTSVDDLEFRYLEAQGGQLAREQVAWQKLVLPRPQPFRTTEETADIMLRARFGLAEGVKARPLQHAAVEAARNAKGPALVFIEDAMGAGKTEAGLLCAEILGAKTGMAGLLIALPTQATTDAMFVRVIDYLKHLHSLSGSDVFTASLLHGKGQWNPQYSQLRRSGRTFLENAASPIGVPSGNHQSWEDGAVKGDGQDIIAHSWLSGKKKSILAQFVTSTIDHLLLAALQQKHLMLRHFGLTQKVVVIDEAHASSEFMNVFATRVVEWLGAYQVPVVVLSATLHHELKERLATGYLKGAGVIESWQEAQLPHHDAYPRLTVVEAEEQTVIPVAPATAKSRVVVKGHTDGSNMAEQIRRLASNRQGCLLVVKNTVLGAQELYAELRQEFDDHVGLFHSRFTVADRLAKDEWLRDHFGDRDRTKRPSFYIAICTQVAEQSLDVDFDVLLTDLAPTDLLLQRIGRMHRHERSRPEDFLNPTCHVFGVPPTDSSPELDPGSAAVYGQFQLLRSALLLGEQALTDDGTEWVLPAQIGELVEASQSGSLRIPEEWAEQYQAAEQRFERDRKCLSDKAGIFLLNSPKKASRSTMPLTEWIRETGDPESNDSSVRPKVRDGEESYEVILVQRRGKDYFTVGGETKDEILVDPHSVPSIQQAISIAKGTIRLPRYLTGYNAQETDEILGLLESADFRPFAWDSHYLLNGQLYLVLEEGEASLGPHRLRYSREQGLTKA